MACRPLRALALFATSLAVVDAAAAQGCDDLPHFQVYGAGTSGALGMPELTRSGVPAVDQSFSLGLAGGVPSAPAVMLFSASEGALPLPDFGATLHLGLPFFQLPLFLDATGAAATAIGIDPVPAAFCGTTLHFQAAVLDATAQGFAAFTPAARVHFGTAQPAPLFPAPFYPFDGNVNDLARGDFDADGRMDFAMVSGLDISVYLSQGAGVYAPAVVSAGVGTADGIVAGDLDGDGFADLLVSRPFPAPAVFEVLHGQGDGTFVVGASFPSETNGARASLADLDGDSALDLVHLSNSTGEVRVLLGQGDGTFGPHSVALTTSPSAVTIEDVDSDGELDLVVVDNVGVQVLLGVGDGGFMAPVQSPAVLSTAAITTGDLDGDDLSDLIVGDFAGGAAVLLNTGAGGFSAPDFFPLGGSIPFSIDTGDFDGDGRLDVVVGNLQNPGLLSILSGNGDGTLAPVESVEGFLTVRRVAAEDLDFDGRDDLVVASNPGLSVLLSSDGGSFGAGATFAAGSVPIDLVLANLDGDASLDALALSAGPNELLELSGKLDGTFDPAQSVVGAAQAFEMVVADFDSDGALDVALVGQNEPVVSLGVGDGTFGPLIPIGPDTSGSDVDLASGDIDGDGVIDIVVLEAPGVSKFLGNGDGTFASSAPISIPFLTSLQSIALTDVDGDGALDMVIAQTNFGSMLHVFLGAGNGTFGGAISQPIGTFQSELAFGDVTGDGTEDLILSGGELQVFPGQPGMTYGAPQTVGTAGGGDVEVADLDGDGVLDLVVASGTSVDVYLGLGAGAFGPPSGYGLSTSISHVAIADVDQDGRPDLVTLSNEGLGVLLNQP